VTSVTDWSGVKNWVVIEQHNEGGQTYVSSPFERREDAVAYAHRQARECAANNPELVTAGEKQRLAADPVRLAADAPGRPWYEVGGWSKWGLSWAVAPVCREGTS